MESSYRKWNLKKNIYRGKGVDVIGLKEHNAKNPEDLKIDRIIFIASANTPLPKRLIEAVKKTAQKENRGRAKVKINYVSID